MPSIPVPAPPTRNGAPLTQGEISYLFNVGPNAVSTWARRGLLGDVVGKHQGPGRAEQVFAPGPVLNFGLMTGRLDAYWNLVNDEGHAVDRDNPPPRASGRRGIPPEPTMDLRGRRYFFVPHAAARLGVEKDTIKIWRVARNTGFPAPDATVEGRPTWFEETLVKWGQEATPPRLNEAGDPVSGAPARFKRSA